MKQFPVLTSQTAVANSAGVATTTGIGPNIYGHTWQVNLVSISNDGTVNQSTCDVYLNAVAPSYRLGGTWSGNKDSNSDVRVLQCGDKLIAQWTGCDPGSNCLILISGVGTDQR